MLHVGRRHQPRASLGSPDRRSVIAGMLRAAGCVFADDEARILIAAARTPAELDAMVDKRISGQPIEHVVGWAEFCGLRIAVEPGVFVPRRRTEFLVRQAVALVNPGSVVVDLCCGSGAVAAAVVAAMELEGPIEVAAVDIDPIAVGCARRNLEAAGGTVYQGDLYEPLPVRLRGRVDVLVANAPYVPTDAIELLATEARSFEPRRALDGGDDGLDIVRRVATGAPDWLAPGGHLLVETSQRQATTVTHAFAEVGLMPEVVESDELEATVIVATRPTPSVAQTRAGV